MILLIKESAVQECDATKVKLKHRSRVQKNYQRIKREVR